MAACDGKRPRNSWAALACAGLVAGGMFALVAPGLAIHAPPSADGVYYVEMAAGRLATTPRPFANRFFEPLLARQLSSLLGTELTTSFFVLTSAALLVFCVAIALTEIRLTPWWFCACSGAAFSERNVSSVSVARSIPRGAGRVVFLERRSPRLGTSLAIILSMQLTRESTLLLAAIAIPTLAFQGERRWAAALAAATLLGVAIAAWATRSAPPNVHAMPELVYLACKAPFNFATNFLGLNLWVDSLPNTHARRPLWTYTLPAWAPTGEMRAIGYAGFSVERPLNIVVHWATMFGVFPTLVALAILRDGRACPRRYPPAAAIAMFYGLIAFFTAPMLGAWWGRLLTYGWPLVLAGPAVLARLRPSLPAVLGILAIQFVSGWSFVAPGLRWGPHEGNVTLLALNLALHGLVIVVCGQWFQNPKTDSPSVAAASSASPASQNLANQSPADS